MQEFKHFQDLDDDSKKAFRRLYHGETEAELVEKMGQDAKAEKRRGNAMTRRVTKIGRNELCPCGSGQKFKKCCIGELR